MKGYQRREPSFALCGLNCLLCPMHVGGWCPGCGGGEGHQPCAFIRCSLQHGAQEHCFACAEYPCPRFAETMAYDSFVPHSRMQADLEEARAIGLAAYHQRLMQKEQLLQKLLERYNDGRKKTLFCSAASLLPLETLADVLRRLEAEVPAEMHAKEKAARAAALLIAAAQQQGINLKLRKKAQNPSA